MINPNITEKDKEDFLRIAEARLRKVYFFPPQRRAVVARMLIDWLKRKSFQQ